MANSSDGGVIIDVNLNVQETEKEISNVKNKIVKMEEEVGEKNARKSAIEEEMERAGAAADAAKAKLDELIKERERLKELGPQDGSEYLTAKASLSTLDEEIKQQQAMVDGLQKTFDKVYDSVEKYNTEINSTNAAIQYQKDLYTELEIKAAELHAQEEQAAAEKRAQEEAEKEAAERAAEIERVRAQAVADREAAESRAASQVQASESGTSELAKKTRRAADEAERLNGSMKKTEKSTKKATSAFGKFEKRIVGLVKRVFVFSLITSALRNVRTYFGDIIKQNDQAMEAVAKLKGALLTLAQPIIDYVIPAFTKFVNKLVSVATYIANIVAKLFGTTLEAAAKSAEAMYDTVNATKEENKQAKKLQKTLADFDEIHQLTSSTAEEASTAIKPDFSLQTEGIEDFWGGIVKFIARILDTVDDLVARAIDAIIQRFNLSGTMIGDILDGIKEIFHGAVTFIKGILLGDLDLTIDGVEKLIDGLKRFVIGVWDGLQRSFNSFLDWLDDKTGGKLHEIIEFVRNLVNGNFDFIKATVEVLFDTIKDVLSGIVKFIAGVFSDDWDLAWQGVKDILHGVLEGVVNLLVEAINLLIGRVESAINFGTDAARKITGGIVDLPSVNLPRIPRASIPRLAQGAVIPANREFLAVLGDQKSGTNVEAPLETIMEAMRTVMEEYGGGDLHLTVNVGGERFIDTVINGINRKSRAMGASVINV